MGFPLGKCLLLQKRTVSYRNMLGCSKWEPFCETQFGGNLAEYSARFRDSSALEFYRPRNVTGSGRPRLCLVRAASVLPPPFRGHPGGHFGPEGPHSGFLKRALAQTCFRVRPNISSENKNLCMYYASWDPIFLETPRNPDNSRHHN